MAPQGLERVLKTLIPAVLAFELVLGGQARLTPAFTPTLYQKAMRKAEGTRDALTFIPITDPTRHSNVIGVLMCLAGALVAWKPTRTPYGAGLTLFLTLSGVYSQRRMRIPYWLPITNTALALLMWFIELTPAT